jgi:peptide/nickel transport system substrate-binding protein
MCDVPPRAARIQLRPGVSRRFSTPYTLSPIRFLFPLLLCLLWLPGCARSRPDPHTIVMDIESSPANLDPRIGTDAQAEHIDALIFDALVHRDEHFGLQPFLATSWETPNPTTWVFHLRPGVHFQDAARSRRST